MVTKMNNSGSVDWQDSDLYKEWNRLVSEDARGKRSGGYWTCYYNERNEIVYEYIYT